MHCNTSVATCETQDQWEEQIQPTPCSLTLKACALLCANSTVNQLSNFEDFFFFFFKLRWLLTWKKKKEKKLKKINKAILLSHCGHVKSLNYIFMHVPPQVMWSIPAASYSFPEQLQQVTHSMPTDLSLTKYISSTGQQDNKKRSS